MPNERSVVINTSPLVALDVALDDFSALGKAVERLIVPGEVFQELQEGINRDSAAQTVAVSTFCVIRPVFVSLPLSLSRSLGRGEAAVIHTALTEGIDTVVIDDRKGRRWARMNGLRVTGSLGLVVLLHRRGLLGSIEEAADRMKKRGIFLSQSIIRKAIEASRRTS